MVQRRTRRIHGGRLLNRIVELVLYRVIVPALMVPLWIRLYKTQEIRNNELIRYNLITDQWIDQLGSVN